MDLNYIFELNIYCLDYTFNQINEAIVRKNLKLLLKHPCWSASTFILNAKENWKKFQEITRKIVRKSPKVILPGTLT